MFSIGLRSGDFEASREPQRVEHVETTLFYLHYELEPHLARTPNHHETSYVLQAVDCPL